MQLVTIREHTFFLSNFHAASTIVDVGANVGDFSRECAARFGCVPYAIEPNPSSASQITNARVFNHAIGAATGTGKFFLGPSSEGCSLVQHPDHTDSTIVSVLALQEFLQQQRLDSVDLLKMDIEGAELDLLLALTAPVNIAQISVEFHDFMFPDQAERVTQTMQHMKSIGFECFNFTSPWNIDVLFVNLSMVRLPLKDRLRAMARVVARRSQRQLSARFRGVASTAN